MAGFTTVFAPGFATTDPERTGTEVPLAVLSDEAWAGLPLKPLAGSIVTGVYLDRQWTSGLARLWVWPTPNVGTLSLVLYGPLTLPAFADLTTAVALPQGYVKALRYALAVELASWFGVALTEQVARTAAESLADIKRVNFQPLVLTQPADMPTMARGPYRIEVDG